LRPEFQNILDSMKETATKICENRDLLPQVSTAPVRVYIDGGFDLLHSGHYNAIRQAKNMSDILVAGVNSDADLMINKGPTIMNELERAEILRHCKFVDEVVVGTKYSPDFELLEKLNCGFYAHGDDPCFDVNGVDLTKMFKEKGMYKMFKRTEGVSTTDITGRLLSLCEDLLKKDQQGATGDQKG
jgi:ethanolamine-phosphate cytidylyltransferase